MIVKNTNVLSANLWCMIQTRKYLIKKSHLTKKIACSLIVLNCITWKKSNKIVERTHVILLTR